MTASDLVTAAQTGDEHAFADLVRDYQDMAVAYATSILGDFHLESPHANEEFQGLPPVWIVLDDENGFLHDGCPARPKASRARPSHPAPISPDDVLAETH